VGTEILNLSAVGHPEVKLHLTCLFTVKVPIDGVAVLLSVNGGFDTMVEVANCP
jgi:hypothetical protein